MALSVQRLRGGTKVYLSTSRATRFQKQQALHPQQEIELIQYIDRISKQGLPPNRDMVRRLALQLAQKELGYHWVDRFVQRYPIFLNQNWSPR
jgi:hypothetical protein